MDLRFATSLLIRKHSAGQMNCEMLCLLHLFLIPLIGSNLLQVTGDANASQVLLAVHVYIDNHWLLIKSLNDLFNLFRFSTVPNHRIALEVSVDLIFFFTVPLLFDSVSVDIYLNVCFI